MQQPTVSIVIPAYNVERFIARSIACAQAQGGAEVQIVVVDDGSTDQTAEIARSIAAEDQRIEIVELASNRGRLEARRAGIAKARGQFTMFLDADDELADDAAKTLLEAQEGRFDIVQCDFELRYRAFTTAEERRFNRAFNRPPTTTATGDDITHLVFLKRQTTWSLCGKLMRTALLVEAMSHIPESSITQAEDACIFFIVSCLADSYRGLGDYAGYIYNIDEGSSDARWKVMDLDQFSYSCHYIDSMERIRDFLMETNRYEALEDDYATVRYEHVRAIADKLVSFVRPELRATAFEEFTRLWPVTEVAAALSEVKWDDPAGCMESIAGSKALQCSKRPIRTVGAYHYRMGIGGAERVAAELACLWREMGLNVVFFADEPRDACAFDLPDEIVWITLPEAASMNRGDYLQRARVIAQAVEEYHIDAFVNHQWWSPVLTWDLLLAKSLDVPYCVFCHNIYMVLFYEANVKEFDYSRVLRHADGLVVLSAADKRFWSKFNPRVWQTNNPVTLEPVEQGRSRLTGKNVVWVGRLSSFDKQPQEALEIMARVVSHDPECTLTMVGPAPSRRELMQLKALARRLKIEKNVVFAGPQEDTASFYRAASVHLLTSRLDGWCLVLAESKACGVPCVMYEMDYLTLSSDGRGIVAVGQGDRDAAARAVIELISDEERRRALGQEAFEQSLEISSFDLAAFWTDVFAGLSQGSCKRSGFEADDAEWNLLLDGFKESVRKALDCPIPSYTKHKGMKVARAIVHRLRNR